MLKLQTQTAATCPSRNVPKRFHVYQQKGDMFAEPWLSYLGPKNTPLQNHFIHLAK